MAERFDAKLGGSALGGVRKTVYELSLSTCLEGLEK